MISACMASDTSCRKVHSILVQLPLPDHIDSALVLSKIRVDKDLVDSVTDRGDPRGKKHLQEPSKLMVNTGISGGQPPKR